MNELHLADERENHQIHPVKDSWYTKGGLPANLFHMGDYPIEAVCAVCHRPIVAQSFLRPFEHTGEDTRPGREVEPDWQHFDRD